MAPINDRQALLRRMREARADEQNRVKALKFRLPEAGRTAAWTGAALMAQADWLMVDGGISESLRIQFKQEAMAGDYRHLLATIEAWFTPVVRVEEYVTLADQYADLFDYYDTVIYGAETELLSTVRGLSPEALQEEDELLDSIVDNTAEAERIAEAKRLAEEEVRKRLGLAPDEQVIVKIVKRGGGVA